MDENEVVIIDEDEVVDFIYDNVEPRIKYKEAIRNVIELYNEFLKLKGLI